MGQPGGEPLLGNGVQRAGVGLVALLCGLLLLDRGGADPLVGRLARGVNHEQVVGFDGGIHVDGFAPQLRTQASTVKKRQPDRRAHVPLVRVGSRDVSQPHAAQAEHADHIHVGIELGFGQIHLMQAGFDTPACGRDVGASAQ